LSPGGIVAQPSPSFFLCLGLEKISLHMTRGIFPQIHRRRRSLCAVSMAGFVADSWHKRTKKLRHRLGELIHEGIGWSMGINQIHVGIKSKFGFVPFQPNEPLLDFNGKMEVATYHRN
jgi:hypothetical protein